MRDNNKLRESFFKSVRQDVSDMSFNTWFAPIEIRSIDEGSKTVYITAENDFSANILKSRYIEIIEKGFQKVMKEKYVVIIKTPESYKHDDENLERVNEIKKEEPVTQEQSTFSRQRITHPEYTFDNFVVGSGNKYAHAAALAVAESPSKAYNPLFIYGDSGLGKTHLMHAIAIYLSEHRPELNVLYVSSEMFTNELIKALGENKQREFKNKYRRVDVLLIDDIQFLENKETTQEEFFHTFNDLYDLNKQIVITSDRPPNELTTLEERLRSRFSWNMIAGLSPSDYETRVAILVKKSQNFRMEMDDDLYQVICLIAEKITDNIRELEGALNRINSFSKLLHEHIDVTFAKGILTEILKNNKSTVTPDKIKTTVCHKFNLKISEIDSSKRTSKVAYPRQIAMYLCRNMTDYSYTQIGNYFGGRHYTTVMHACEVIQKEIGHDEEKRNLITSLKEEIKA